MLFLDSWKLWGLCPNKLWGGSEWLRVSVPEEFRGVLLPLSPDVFLLLIYIVSGGGEGGGNLSI